MAINVHLYQSPITNESRILKITKTLSKKGYFDEIHIVGLYDKGLLRVEVVSDNIRIVRVKNFFHTTNPESKLRYLTLIEWNLRVLILYLFKKVSCVNAHSVPVLPVAFLLKTIHRALFIYDTHELETETETGGISKKLSKIMERAFVRSSDLVIVVGNSIRDWYRENYNLSKLLVIKNIPHASTVDNIKDLKKQFAIPPTDLLFIYQGNLSELRGVNEIISVFMRAPKDKHILFMGFGNLTKKIQRLAGEVPNIHYHPAVPPLEILSYTAGADIGIHIIPNSCLNNYFCLPNKLFEYVLAGIPFIGSDFPDIRSEFGIKKVAWLIKPSEENLMTVIKTLTLHEVHEYRNNTIALRETLTWEAQEPLLYQIYDELLQK